MTAPVRADRDRTLWGPAKNLFGDLRSTGLAEAVREGDADCAEQLTREITIGTLQELDILAPGGRPTA